MYIKRKNEKTKNVERRKERWTEKMMQRSRNETLSLQMHAAKREQRAVPKGYEVLYNERDDEKEELEKEVEKEAKKRESAEKRIDGIEHALHKEVGQEFLKPTMREKRRRIKHRVLEESNLRDQIMCQGEIPFAEADFIELEIRGAHLKNLDEGGISDPYFTLCRNVTELDTVGDKKGVSRGAHEGKPKKITSLCDIGKTRVKKVIYKSEAKMNTLKPYWNVFRVSLDALCGKKLDEQIIVEVWDWDTTTEDDKIGRLTTTLKEILMYSHLNSTENGDEWLTVYNKVTATGMLQFMSARLGKDEVEDHRGLKRMDTRIRRASHSEGAHYDVIEGKFQRLKYELEENNKKMIADDIKRQLSRLEDDDEYEEFLLDGYNYGRTTVVEEDISDYNYL